MPRAAGPFRAPFRPKDDLPGLRRPPCYDFDGVARPCSSRTAGVSGPSRRAFATSWLLALGCFVIPTFLGAGCDSGGEADPASADKLPDPAASPPEAPAPGGLRRLLGHQYSNAVRDLLGAGPASVASPPPDSSIRGLDSIGAAELALSESALVAYEASARKIAAKAREDQPSFANLTACSSQDQGAGKCFESFVRRFGRLAWRRPLEDAEVLSYVGIANKARDTFKNDSYDGNADGYEYAVAALLQSPNFLYLVELGVPDAKQPQVRKLTGYEVASRLSFFVLDTTPSGALLDEAAAGKLDTTEGVRASVTALLDTPQASAGVAAFYGELFKLRDLPGLSKDATTYPSFSRELATSMSQETMLFLDDIVFKRNSDFREIFDAPYTFVDTRLAAHYGLTPPAAAGVFEKRTVGGGRAGLLGQASFLSLFSPFASTSPTRRGKFILESLLCQDISPPPPGVITKLPDDPPGKPQTMRQRLEQHRNNPTCAGCHASMDGVGLALERFDGIGKMRDLDNGLPIDTASSLPGVGSFSSPAELGRVLREDPGVGPCVVRGFFRHSMGHVETPAEARTLAALGTSFAGGGFKVKALLADIVSSPAFLAVGDPR